MGNRSPSATPADKAATGVAFAAFGDDCPASVTGGPVSLVANPDARSERSSHPR